MAISQQTNPTRFRTERLAEAYVDAKEYVVNAGFGDEIDWQSDVVFDETTESTFLREAAWVVLSSGFRESVVCRLFPRVSAAFFDWVDANSIAAEIEKCRESALQVFANRRKIDSIVSIVLLMARDGIHHIKRQIHSRGTDYIRELPYMGPVTSLHLAKNLGIPVAKPDRHLLRVTEAAGYDSPMELCTAIAEFVGDSIAVVDLVIWRFATLRPDYISAFARNL